MSDLTNPTKNWTESYKWTCLVYEEFFVQGDKEKELHIPVGMLNDRSSINLAKSQIGFIDFIVQPSFELFNTYLPKVQKNMDQVKWNREKWTNMVTECNTLQEEGNDLIRKFGQLEAEEINEIRLNKKMRKNEDNKKTADIVDPLDDHFEGLNPAYKVLDKPNENPTIANRVDSEAKES